MSRQRGSSVRVAPVCVRNLPKYTSCNTLYRKRYMREAFLLTHSSSTASANTAAQNKTCAIPLVRNTKPTTDRGRRPAQPALARLLETRLQLVSLTFYIFIASAFSVVRGFSRLSRLPKVHVFDLFSSRIGFKLSALPPTARQF